MKALILAGSRGGVDPVAVYGGVSDKALIEIGGETMLARVAGALRGAGIEDIAVACSAEAVAVEARKAGVAVLPAAAGPSASALAGFDTLGAPMLLTTADHALLRPEWITAFVKAVPSDVDVAVLLARREVIEHDVPGTRRTYLKFADGDWSGCNLFLLATPAAGAALTLWQTLERDRKKPWRIVGRLGVVPLIRYLAGRLTLAEALATIGRRIGITACFVEASDGMAAVDVDKPDDLDLVRRIAS